MRRRGEDVEVLPHGGHPTVAWRKIYAEVCTDMLAFESPQLTNAKIGIAVLRQSIYVREAASSENNASLLRDMRKLLEFSCDGQDIWSFDEDLNASTESHFFYVNRAVWTPCTRLATISFASKLENREGGWTR